MKNFKCKLLLSMIVAVTFSCSLLEPETENRQNFDRVLDDPFWTDGLLERGYDALRFARWNNSYRWDEVATDDAVSNDPDNNYRRIAGGSWTSANNPSNVWGTSFGGIQYINSFLEIVDEQTFRTEEKMDALYKRRLKGEAYALRGALKYALLRHHGGVGADGQLLGTPIFDEYLRLDSDFGKPREKFVDCVQSAYDDFDEAIKLLPFDYSNLSSVDDIPENFSDLRDGTQSEILLNIASYNYTCGNKIKQRMSGRIALAYKTRLALLHASPAFNHLNDVTLWERAAECASILLDDVGGVSGLDPVGHIFWQPEQVNSCNITAVPPKDLPEFIWRKPNNENRVDYEQNNFPPSLQGSGQTNPTQNFVDAFPMLDGYPVGKSATYRYNENDPYVNRDPRLSQIVIYNGDKFKGKNINTSVGLSIDCLENMPTSTRTGYYLKKLLRDDVNVGTNITLQYHIDAFIRYTEIFLIYAEAANEAYGPTGDPNGKGYNAKSVIGAIRERGGIEDSDPYLVSINNKDDMRKLIHNERRIELSFESFRFWDLRRWSKPEQIYDCLKETAMGVRIQDGVYERFEVEPRNFMDYMIYGPIPKSDLDKFKYIQNNGWY